MGGRRKLARFGGPALIALATALCVQPAAAFSANVFAADEGSHGAIRIEADASAAYAVDVSDTALTLSFEEPVDADFLPAALALPGYLQGVEIIDGGRAVRFDLWAPVNVEHTRLGPVIMVELRPKASSAINIAARKFAAVRPRLKPSTVELSAPASDGPALARARFFPREGGDRLIVSWSRTTGYRAEDKGDGVWEFTFDAGEGAEIDLIPTLGQRPAYLRSIKADAGEGKARLYLSLVPGSALTHLSDERAFIVNIAPPKPVVLAAPVTAAQETSDPAPIEPIAPADLRVVGRYRPDSLDIEIFAADKTRRDPRPKAAFFVNNQDLWALFPGERAVDLPTEWEDEGRYLRKADVIPSGTDATLVRFRLTGRGLVEAQATDTGWRLRVDPQVDAPPDPIPAPFVTDPDAGRAGRKFELSDGFPISLPPIIFGRAATAYVIGAPVRGFVAPRGFDGMTVLPSAHGLLLAVDDKTLDVSMNDEGIFVMHSAAPIEAAPPELDGAGAIDVAAWSLVGREGEYDETVEVLELALEEATAEFFAAEAVLGEADGGDPKTVEDAQNASIAARERLALARNQLAEFYLANRLGAEALVALAAGAPAEGTTDPRLDALTGLAHVQMHQPDMALTALSAEPAHTDLHVRLWRGLASAQAGRWVAAREDLDAAEPVFKLYPGDWRADFDLARAEAALRLNDGAKAQDYLRQLSPRALNSAQAARGDYIYGDIARLIGDGERARRHFGAALQSEMEPYASQAQFGLVQLDIAEGVLDGPEGRARLADIRYRWPGGALERQILLASAKSALNDFALTEALATFREVVDFDPESPEATEALELMTSSFANLFLSEEAALSPLDWLSIFYDNIDLAPSGEKGDVMVRKLADRLAELDLIEPAAQLLKHQIDDRLRGAARSDVGLTLAELYLSDRRPMEALRALRSTRFARLDPDLQRRRRLLEARSLAALERWDPALELLERARERAAQELRADILWKTERWADAGAAYRALLPSGVFSAADGENALRAAIAYSFAQNNAALQSLAGLHGASVARTPSGGAFAAIVERRTAAAVPLDRLGAELDEATALERFMDDYRARYSSGG